MRGRFHSVKPVRILNEQQPAGIAVPEMILYESRKWCSPRLPSLNAFPQVILEHWKVLQISGAMKVIANLQVLESKRDGENAVRRCERMR